jgi:hypothetical protein
VETVFLDGASSDIPITLSRTTTVGREKTSSATITATFSAGLSLAFSVTVCESTEVTYEIPVYANTEVTVTQKVAVGYMTYPNSYIAIPFYVMGQEPPQYGFRVRLPIINVRSKPLTGL